MTAAQVLFLTLAASNPNLPDGLYDFTATWCGPCQQMAPVVHGLQRQGYPVYKVDVDKHRDMAQRFGVTSIPAFVLIVNGKEVNRVVGAKSEGQLKRLLDQVPQYASRKSRERQPAAVANEPPRRTLPLSRSQDDRRQPQEPIVRAKYDEDDQITAETSTAPDPMASSVRIRVKDAGGVNYGSGTLIDSRRGQSLVLTCGHVFRNVDQEATIEVDVFAGDRHETYVGRVVRFNLEADCGLIAIPTDSVLPTAPVAPAGAALSEGETVYSIGCGGGETPARKDLHVTALNRYRGPDNVECTGVPIPGRSGGGLFDTNGRLIGVCFAQDKVDRRGLYCGLKPIHELLDQCELSRLYQRGGGATEPPPQTVAAVTNAPVERADEEGPPFADAVAAEAPPADAELERTAEAAALSDPQVQEALAQAGDAEVICIIRPLDDPQAASRV
ncbi:MAG: trypsin-like peptidase domain-containing protein, partial [Planctomycetaceae bacterium]